ncbi:hypothetical protein NLJ89_g10435 [Agrocybe chaxingu]|uniref:Uncharacterized protein n=1 Tax=Agrocybe chaxingu TaxID=84603 RepID=A0A9W8MQA2_9AGAR|nr:hypothetical protein NLJ89_g10435 [Agrocybe chaxingu]
MSGLSPARRLVSKTSDITDFFRGHSSNQAQNDASTSNNPTLEVPHSDSEAVMGKKKITRIPLFGRSRKKSNQSAASSPFTASLNERESADLGGQSSRAPSTSTDRRQPEPSSVVEQPPPLPTSSKVPSSSLSSKFAAHFSHSRSSKVPVTAQIISAPIPSSSRQASGLTPQSPRSGSSDSGSSGGSKARSTTPRPTQPTITVSLSPDNPDDLFTRFTSTTAKRASEVPKPRTKDRNAGQTSSTPPSSSTSTPEPSIYRRGHTPASAIAAAVRHQHNPSNGSDRPPSTSSKNSNSNSNSRKNSDSDKSHDKHDGSSTPRLSDPRESPRPTVPEKDRGLPPSLQRRASVATGSVQTSENGSASIRSRMKQPAPPARTRPPSMPLPLPPAPSTPPPEVPASPRIPFTASIRAETQSASQNGHAPRQRAHTLAGSVANPSAAALPPLSRPGTTGPLEVPPVVEGETLDVDTASVEQLRKALKTRNRQYDELATYVLKVTEAHVAEILALEKKIHALSKDVARRDTEIKGLKYMINDEEPPKRTKTLPPGLNASSRLSPAGVRAAVVDSDQEVHSSPAGPSRRLYYQSDSGTESHAHSGAESIRASGASGSESVSSSVLRGKKIRRPFHLAEFGANLTRAGSTRRSSKLGPGGAEEVPYSKRTSLSSTSPSPSSSTSSLLPPSPSITMSSLSAIPEGPPSSFLRYESSDQQEERRALRASNRTSMSSMTSSSSTAASSSAYSIKRSRPTSIAQVLEKSPNMDDVLEKLRPFA